MYFFSCSSNIKDIIIIVVVIIIITIIITLTDVETEEIIQNKV
jgi:hypothetical protein